MGKYAKRFSQFRGINRSLQPGALDLEYAYNAENVDIVGGRLSNQIGSERLVSAVDVPAGRPLFLFSPSGNYLIVRGKYIAMGNGYIKRFTILGDANCDGRVSAADVALVQGYIAGTQTLSDQGFYNADVNFDDQVTQEDADLILNNLVGLADIPTWDDMTEPEVGPFEPDRPPFFDRSLEDVVNATGLYVRGVGRNAVRANINNEDCIIVSGMLDSASGDYHIERGFYVDGPTAKTAVYYLGNEATPKVHIRQFGSGQALLKNKAIAAVDVDSDGKITSVTLYETYANLTDAQKDRALLDGIFLFKSQISDPMTEDDINSAFMWLKVTSITESGGGNAVFAVETTRLASEAAVGDYVLIRGQCSDMTVTCMQMYYGRLFAAAHRSNTDHPRRLYWSCLPGDGRTIEDWTMSEASVDTSGGHVDIGDPSDGYIANLIVCGSQMLIFTKNRLWRLYGTAPSNYTVELVGDLEGSCVSNPVEINGTVYWLSLAGISYYNGSYISFVDDDYSTRHIINSLPKYLKESMTHWTVHADLFDNSIMFAFDSNSDLGNVCLVLRYELETGNVIKYLVPCSSYRQQFTDAIKDNYGATYGSVIRQETRYFQALVHTDGTMTMTQWYDWERQPFLWYDEKDVKSVWQTGWTDMQSPEAVKKLQTICLRGSGEFVLTIESENNKDVKVVRMPENEYTVKEITPKYAEGRSFRFTIESSKPFTIEPYMTLLYDVGGVR